MHKRMMKGSREGKFVVGSAELLHGQRVEGIVRSAKKNAKLPEPPREESKTGLQFFL